MLNAPLASLPRQELMCEIIYRAVYFRAVGGYIINHHHTYLNRLGTGFGVTTSTALDLTCSFQFDWIQIPRMQCWMHISYPALCIKHGKTLVGPSTMCWHTAHRLRPVTECLMHTLSSPADVEVECLNWWKNGNKGGLKSLEWLRRGMCVFPRFVQKESNCQEH